MTDPTESHFNQLTPAEAERLALLLEEMGEAQQAIGKILRHGYQSTHPDRDETNRYELECEIGDVKAAILLMEVAGDINAAGARHSRDLKLEKVRQYLHHQEAK